MVLLLPDDVVVSEEARSTGMELIVLEFLFLFSVEQRKLNYN